jgi:hypothetical protein
MVNTDKTPCKCGTNTKVLSYPKKGPVYCPDCCPEHDYKYERYEGWTCTTCGAEPPPDWFDVS